MNPLAPDEKIALVMVYTNNMLIRGDIVIQENLRVSIWLRTQGVLNHVHLYKPQVILFGGTPPKSLSYSEIYIPTSHIIAFHLAPPEQDPLDYDSSEPNRIMQPLDMVVGSFLLKGKVRMATQMDLTTHLDVSHSGWMSVYDGDISNPYLPQFSVQVPMLLVNPGQVNFGLV